VGSYVKRICSLSSVPVALQISCVEQPGETNQYVLMRFFPIQLLIWSLDVPKVYVVGGLGFVYFFLIFLNYGGQLLTNLAGFIIPGYYSMNALFTVTKIDDTQWLT
jgi:hypothetical protein